MSVSRDIVATYFRPREVIRRRAAGSQREDRALVLLLIGCLMVFVAQWPRLAREAHFADGITFQDLLAGALFGWIFVAPLALYLLAAASHLIARLLGGQGTWYGARMALFWALLAAAPLWLFHGLVAGFIGEGPALSGVGLLALTAFLIFWIVGLAEVERGRVRT